MGRKVKDITGNRYGQLVVISFNSINEEQYNKAYWNVRCDCGNFDIARSDRLTQGRKKSCGCLGREVGIKNLKMKGEIISKKGIILEKYEKALFAILDIAFENKQNSIFEIALELLQGSELDEKYRQNTLNGAEILKFAKE